MMDGLDAGIGNKCLTFHERKPLKIFDRCCEQDGICFSYFSCWDRKPDKEQPKEKGTCLGALSEPMRQAVAACVAAGEECFLLFL